ncbi:hypothetical protein PTTG_29895, partial [Puccinia triticina 1-1 BBBD Race 1]
MEPAHTSTSPRSTPAAEPSHSQSTPRSTSAPGVRATGGESAENASGGSRTGGARAAWSEQKDAAKLELQAIDLRRGLPSGPNPPRELPVDRAIQIAKPRELEPLTLADASRLLSKMFSEIEQVVDGNSKQAMCCTESFRAALSKYMQKDLTTPMAN